jgi:hypothetical protein
MKGDFSRNTFDPHKHFTRVLMQQGRVQLDADWNEQSALLLHYARTLAADLIGPHGGPADELGFKIEMEEDRVTVGAGRYYVEGIPCANEPKTDENGNLVPFFYEDQPAYPFPDSDALEDGGHYLLYLDVWERHVTHIEEPSIREVALGGPDTATRTQVIWQVKAVSFEPGDEGEGNEARIEELEEELEELQAALAEAEEAGEEERVRDLQERIEEVEREIERLREEGEAPDTSDCEGLLADAQGRDEMERSSLRAEAYVETPPEDACITPPEARYRGAENQLYRVEIHDGSTAYDEPTFKWSRDNGSMVAAWIGRRGNNLIVSGVRDRRGGFAAGEWVELTDDAKELRGEPGTMVRVVKAEGDRVTIDPETASDSVAWSEDLKNPKVRRWDHEASPPLGAVPLEEGKWLDLEDGIRVKFGRGGTYYTGDYWLIPARTATGDVEWPKELDDEGKVRRDADDNPIPEALPPRGITHYYAPLAIISDNGIEKDCRRRFEPLAVPV